MSVIVFKRFRCLEDKRRLCGIASQVTGKLLFFSVKMAFSPSAELTWQKWIWVLVFFASLIVRCIAFNSASGE